ncbi:MAG: two-component regulator propeller domain-containing protein [Chitinispirillaceae bacterium]|jgi:ligand-binding sensor domain-containing protein
MIKPVLMAVMIAATPILAAGGKQGRAASTDEVVYDQPTEWRLFSIDWPVRAFALQGTTLWCATEPFVASINTRSVKKADYQKMKELGAMPADSIAAVAVDKQGRVWFGGPNGAAMKNGSQITVFTAENGLSGTRVSAIVTAGDGGVWVGTDNGADLFLGGTWKQYTVKEGLVSNKIQTILVDGKGSVWFGTDKGISVFDGLNWKSYTMKDGMSWNDTRALAYDRRKQMVWAAVGEKDVNCFDGQKWNVYMEIQPGITTIMVDSQSRIWFGHPAGLIKFNGDDWISDPKQLGVPAASVYQLYCDEKGNMWLATENGVIFRANPYPY